MRFFFFAVLFLFSFITSSQIINIEALRLAADTSGFSGRESFTFNITRNTTELIRVNNNLAMQYARKRHVFLLLNDINFTFSDETDFEKGGFFHLRYNHRHNKIYTLETFFQYQVDIPLRIEQRILLGAGPRINIIKKPTGTLIIGSLPMYEHDKELGNDIQHNDFRLSNYISASLSREQFRLSALVYYQPRLDYWRDFRTSAQVQVEVKIWKTLALLMSGSLSYDAFPVLDPDIPKLTYKLTNGLSYSF